MDKNKISTTPQEKKFSSMLTPFVGIIAYTSTVILCHYALKSHFLPQYFNVTIPHEFNFEYKISLLARIAVWISFVLIFNVSSVICARGYSKAVNPLKDQTNELVTLSNKVLTNTVEQTLMFLPLLVNWVVNCSNTDAELKQGVSLAIIWVAGRVIFSISYFLGYLMNFTVLRAFGFGPSIFASAVLSFRLAGIYV